MPSVKYTSPRREAKAPSAWSFATWSNTGRKSVALPPIREKFSIYAFSSSRSWIGVSDRTWSSHWRMRMFTFRVKVSVLRRMA